MIFGAPKDCSMMTFRPMLIGEQAEHFQPIGSVKSALPFGPSVTETASASTSTPASMATRPSLENLISLCAPRARTALATFGPDLRTAEDERAGIIVEIAKEKRWGEVGVKFFCLALKKQRARNFSNSANASW